MTECVFLPDDTVLLYGDTGAGKTGQIGEAAEHVDLTTGQGTVLYSMDRGGAATVRPHITAGIIDYRPLFYGDPWVAINAAVQGKKWDGKQWVPADNSKIGLIAFEGLSSMAESIMVDMAGKNARGQGIGGKASFVLINPDGTKFAGNTQTDYAGVQTFITEKVWQSQGLGKPVIWTSHVKRGSDEENMGQTVLGPVVAGKALTTVVPRWFTYTFRLDAIPMPAGRPRHVLHIEEHAEMAMKGFGNARIPLGAQVQGFKSIIEPASVVCALQQIRAAEQQVANAILARRKK